MSEEMGRPEKLYDLAAVLALHQTASGPMPISTARKYISRGLLVPTVRLGGKNFFNQASITRFRVALDLEAQKLSRERADQLRRLKIWTKRKNSGSTLRDSTGKPQSVPPMMTA